MPKEDYDVCRFCGNKGAYGYGCQYAENNVHVAIGDEDHCIYCGSSEYNGTCTYAAAATNGETTKHVHGHGGSKCIWCGSTEKGFGCPHSPDGKHHF